MWPSPSAVDALEGARLIEDGSAVSYPEIAIARAALRTNPELSAAAALELAHTTLRAADANALSPEFLAAALLQESAYDPQAVSSAGAVGIAQFTIDTAARYDVNPFDPFDAIDGAAFLIGKYYRAYASRYDDPYAAALAAYNAGPGAVAYYDGVPPYAETRAYISLIFQRWARIASYERTGKDLAAGVEARSNARTK